MLHTHTHTHLDVQSASVKLMVCTRIYDQKYRKFRIDPRFLWIMYHIDFCSKKSNFFVRNEITQDYQGSEDKFKISTHTYTFLGNN